MTDEPWVEIYRAKDAVEAQLACEALEDAGIAAMVDGEQLSSALGGMLGWSVAPRILVPPAEAERARELLQQREPSDEVG
jgi:Putative prokaryotic signal transducing protein